jgi:hypothetical protein
MGVFSGFFQFLSGTPALVGLFLAALVIFLTSDWRVSLSALLVQYLFVGLLLTRAVRPEVALVKTLVGVLVVVILALSTRYVRRAPAEGEVEPFGPHFLGLHLGWLAGPQGFPMRLLSVLLVVLGLVSLFGKYHVAMVPLDLALLATWMAAMGMLGLVLSGDPVRVAAAVLTIMAGFDLVYSSLERSFAQVGFLSACYLVAALAFAYLTSVHALATSQSGPEETRS